MYTKEELLCNIRNDNVEEAWEFYRECWGISDKKVFTGETIISFNTVANCTIRMFEKYLKGKIIIKQADKLTEISCSDLPQTIKDKFNIFYSLYHSRANFMLFPKGGKSGGYTLQSVKGSRYHDFPDLFLKDVRQYYIGGEVSCVGEKNTAYFDIFGKGEEGYKNYIEYNYLQDLFIDEEYRIPIKLSPCRDIKMLYRKPSHIPCDDEKEAFYEYVNTFLDKAAYIITKRAERLAESKKTGIFTEKAIQQLIKTKQKQKEEQ